MPSILGEFLFGSATFSARTSPTPWKVIAFMASSGADTTVLRERFKDWAPKS